jgi:hypothetical protein
MTTASADQGDQELALTPTLQVLSTTIIERVRELPLQGEVLVKAGDVVQAEDIVARAELPGELLVIRTPERLGIEVFEAVMGLKVREGDTIEEGQLLCEHVGLFGLFSSRLNSPVAGVVDFFSKSTGHLGIRLSSTILRIKAYLPGTIIKVVDGSSVTIRSECAFVQGVFGVGGPRYGKIHVLEETFDRVVEVADLPEDCSGLVLVGGTHPRLATLQEAAQRGATGFVTGSIDDATLTGYIGHELGIALTGDEEVSMTVVITEGFGVLSMSNRAREVLRAGNGQRVSMNGATQVRAGAVRPEIVLPTQPLGSVSAVPGALGVGRLVRVIRAPYFGEIGEIVDLPTEPQLLASGARARVAAVALGSHEVIIPRANLELL